MKTVEKYEKAKAEVDAGMIVSEACKKHGIATSNYYNYRARGLPKVTRKTAKKAKKTKTPRFVDIPLLPKHETREERVGFAYGSVTSIKKLMTEITWG